MERAWSLDLRRRAGDAFENGEGTPQEVAARLCIGRTTLCDLLRRYRATDSLAPTTVRGHRPRRVDAAGRELIKEVVAAQPDGTLAELTAAYNERAKTAISRTIFGCEVRALKLTWKKNAEGL